MLAEARHHTGLRAQLEAELPDRLCIGRGNSLFLHGWAFDPESRIRRLRIGVGGELHDIGAHSMPRADVHGVVGRELDPRGLSYWSGFWGAVDLARVRVPKRVALSIEAELHDGRRESAPLGDLELAPAIPYDMDPDAWIRRPPMRGPRLYICMPTYNPKPELLEIQIDSIRRQSFESWNCMIFDDASDDRRFERILELVGGDDRFAIYRGARRLGYYRNTERALAHVPYAAELVALADQDDHWHPDKLARLVDRLDGGALLAYCNSRVDTWEPGLGRTTRGLSYWEESGRANEYRRLGSLILANSVTGAASAFHRHLLSYLLPFPASPGIELHDQWLATTARSLGRIEFVEDILHDWVMHYTNVTLTIDVSHRTPRAPGRTLYAKEVLRPQIHARVLAIRTHGLADRRRRRAIARAAGLERPRGFAWLLRRWLIPRPWRTETVGLESLLMRGVLWRWATGRRARRRRKAAEPAADTGSILAAANEAAPLQAP